MRRAAAVVWIATAVIGTTSAAWGLDKGGLEKAGVSAAVRGDIKRVAQDNPVGVRVASGDPIYRFDRITSGPDSGLQVVLLDETTLTIGPNSAITITEFVYDPATGAGKLAASFAKGAFRFVSGKIARHNPADMTVSVPVATIGIRGTIVYGRSDETGAIIGLAGPGAENNTGDKVAGIDVVTADGTAQLRRTGWGAIVTPGAPPVVLQLPPALVSSLLNAVAPRNVPGPAGGPAASSRAASSGFGAASASQISGQASAAALTSLALVADLEASGQSFIQAALPSTQQTGPTTQQTGPATQPAGQDQSKSQHRSETR